METMPKPTKIEKPLNKGKNVVLGSQAGNGGLIFVNDSKLAFYLEDLLAATLEEKERNKTHKKTKPFWVWPWKIGKFASCTTKSALPFYVLGNLLAASAEVLGKGSCGTTYKAMFENGVIVAAKRLAGVKSILCRQLENWDVRKWEFERHMQAIGSIRHDDVVVLMAYWNSKDETWILYDHYSLGSVSSLLHDNRSKWRKCLPWEKRIKIAIGAARGIAHLHEISSSAHGNIKSSNIFLNSKQYGCLSEAGMAAITLPSVREKQPAGYRAPEVVGTRKISQASDVYSFGVLLLELLTGRSPFTSFPGHGDLSLVSWVRSVVRVKWTAKVLDLDLVKDSHLNEEDMVKMLRIGMRCVTSLPSARPKMRDVFALLEDIRAVEMPSSSYIQVGMESVPYVFTIPCIISGISVQ